jgi:quinol monooxygenase YgiN
MEGRDNQFARFVFSNQAMDKMEISTENTFLTLINVFSVDPTDQQKLLDLLTFATEETVSGVDGFISAALHKSLDGKKVSMYAQWRSMDAYLEMRNNSRASPHLERALTISTFDPGMYEIVKVFSPVNEME